MSPSLTWTAITSVLHSVMSLPWSNGLFVDGVSLWSGAAHFLGYLPIDETIRVVPARLKPYSE